MGLHHVGRDPASVRDGIVDPGLIRHVLPQELDPYVHNLHRVQGGTSLLRVSCRMGCDPLESVLRLDTAVAGTAGDLVAVIRMPGQGAVQLFPDTVPGHEGLGCASLFSGTSEEDHGAAAGRLLRQVLLDPHGRSHGACSQHVVAAAVAVSAGMLLVSYGLPCLLGQAA